MKQYLFDGLFGARSLELSARQEARDLEALRPQALQQEYGSACFFPFIEYRGQPPVLVNLGPKPCAWCGGFPPRCCHSEKW